MRTGDVTIDGCLKDLDARLLGGASVRSLTLAEVRDHLLEQKNALLSSGESVSESSAASNAVASFGDLEEIASAQRDSLVRRFRNFGLQMGIPFGILMGLSSVIILHLTGVLQFRLAIGICIGTASGLFNGLFFGISMGWWYSFTWPEKRLPSAEPGRSTGKMPDEPFTVQFVGPTRKLSKIMTILFAIGALCIIALAFLLREFDGAAEYVGIPWWAILGMGVALFLEIPLLNRSNRTFHVTTDGISVGGWLFKKRTIAWSSIGQLAILGETHRWIPRWSNWSKVKYIQYTVGKGKKRRMHLYPGMANMDRLILLLEQKLSSVGSGVEGTTADSA